VSFLFFAAGVAVFTWILFEIGQSGGNKSTSSTVIAVAVVVLAIVATNLGIVYLLYYMDE
jgi:hypothetical protein